MESKLWKGLFLPFVVGLAILSACLLFPVYAYAVDPDAESEAYTETQDDTDQPLDPLPSSSEGTDPSETPSPDGEDVDNDLNAGNDDPDVENDALEEPDQAPSNGSSLTELSVTEDNAVKAAVQTRDASSTYDAQHVNIYRLYNPYSGEHLYTTDLIEAKHIATIGWRWEGIGWVAPKQGNPVYRLYNPYSGDHHYTLSVAERANLVRLGWRYEGIGFMSESSSGDPIYRQFNPNEVIGTHNFTKDRVEDETLGRIGWRREGIAYYATKGPNIKIQGFWLVTASWGSLERYWVESSGNIAKSRFIEISEGSGWTAYAKSSGAVVRGKAVIGSGVLVADNEGRLAKTANGQTGWLNTAAYDGAYQLYYYDAAKRCMRTGFFTVDGRNYYGDPHMGYIARDRLFHANNKWYWANSDGSYRIETDPKGALLRMLNKVSSSSAITTFGSVSFNWNSHEGQLLQQAINNLRNSGYKVGFVMMDLNSGTGFSCSANDAFYSASTIKGPYVAAINHYSPGSVNNYVKSLMSNAILYSDNASYEALRRMYGSGVMSQQMAYSGVPTNNAGSYYYYLSPRDLAKLWVGDYWYFYEDTNANSSWCRSLYSEGRAGANSIIYNALGKNYTVNAKPGWNFVGGGYTVRNDAGIVHASNGSYVISVMTSAYNNVSAVTELVRAIDRVHSCMY